jgi:hypothetical protein
VDLRQRKIFGVLRSGIGMGRDKLLMLGVGMGRDKMVKMSKVMSGCYKRCIIFLFLFLFL